MNKFQQGQQKQQITYCKKVLKSLEGLAKADNLETIRRALKLVKEEQMYFPQMEIVATDGYTYLKLTNHHKGLSFEVNIDRATNSVHFSKIPLNNEDSEFIFFEELKTLLKG